MPLTGKGEKIKGAMEKKYGPEKGEQVFYASKNKGTITGVDDANPRYNVYLNTHPHKDWKNDDNQHMGFSSEGVEPVKKLVSGCDALSKRLDAFEKRKSQPQPVEARKPRTKDNMQPSQPHPKDPSGA